MEPIIKIVVLLLTSLTLFSCGGSGSNQQTISQNGDTSYIKRASSDTELEAYLRQSLIYNYTEKAAEYSYYELASVDSTFGSTTPSVSTTNLQISGVDEMDRLKTDGEYLYTSAIDTPEISVRVADESASKVATLSLETLGQSSVSGLYLRAEASQLLALSGNGRHNQSIWNMWFDADYWQNRQTELFLIDINQPEAPYQQAKLTLDGQLISSRRIGSTLYLVTRHTPSVEGLIAYPENEYQISTNHQLISQATLAGMLPKYQIDQSERLPLFHSEDCFVSDYAQPKYQQTSVISLLAIDLNTSLPTPRGQCYVGDAETLYASANALYLATTRHHYDDESGIAIYRSDIQTDIHKFALDSGQPSYRGSGSVSGHLGWQQDLKPFRMSEHNDTLRVITYTGGNQQSVDSPASLYTLQENAADASLEIVGSLPNASRPAPLGKPGEQIYATRFMGDRAYLVTFRLTDPLYIVDLSDPSDPYIASELEINGYSDYLHPVGENYLLGIGKDAIAGTAAGDGRGAWSQGVKLSLIDVSDITAPFEKSQIIIGKRGTETAVSRSHHALTTLQKGDVLELALPISLHDTPHDSDFYTPQDNPSYFYQWTHDKLYRLSINTQNGEIETLAPIISERQSTSDTEEWIDHQSWDWPFDRSAIIGDQVFYLQGDNVLVQ